MEEKKRVTRSGKRADAATLANEATLAYNTSLEPLKLPEYGRMVLDMVAHALEIEDKTERTAYAYRIIQVMTALSPQLRNMPDYQLKLWDHLAYLSDYQLDIDYPVEIIRYDRGDFLHQLSYPGHKIRLRHYGHLVEALLEELTHHLEAPERKEMIAQAAGYMRRQLNEGKDDRSVNDKIAHDIAVYTDHQVSVEEVMEVFEHMGGPSHGKFGRRNNF